MKEKFRLHNRSFTYRGAADFMCFIGCGDISVLSQVVIFTGLWKRKDEIMFVRHSDKASKESSSPWPAKAKSYLSVPISFSFI